MSNLKSFSDEELENELRLRGKEIVTQERTCAGCRNYNATYKRYSNYYEEWHCNGCNRPENECNCRR